MFGEYRVRNEKLILPYISNQCIFIMSTVAVHPNVGYLNTEFTICIIPDANTNKDINRIEIYRNNISVKGIDKGRIELVKTIDNISGDTIKIKLESAGLYDICTGNEYVRVVVKDAIRFGGSQHKGSYIFDNTPWCFVVMRDRTYFYNRDTMHQYVEAISPESIDIINENVVTFKNDKHIEFSLYSLTNHRVFANYSKGEIVGKNWLIAEDDKTKQLCIVSFTNDEICRRYIQCDSYEIDKDRNSVYTICNNIVSIFSLDEMDIIKEKTFNGGTLMFTNNHYIIVKLRDRIFDLYNVLDFSYIARIEMDNIVDVIDKHVLIDSKTSIEINEQFDRIIQQHSLSSIGALQLKISSIEDLCITNNKVYFKEKITTRYIDSYGKCKYRWEYNIKCGAEIIFASRENIRYISLEGETIVGVNSKDKHFRIDKSNHIIWEDSSSINCIKDSHENLVNQVVPPQYVTAISQSKEYALSISGSYVYIHKLVNDVYSKEEILSSLFDSSKYGNVLLSDDGDNIIYQDKKQLYLKSVRTGDVSPFPNVEFISHNNGYRPLISFDQYRRPRIIDPITRQTIDGCFLAEYTFVSPDGKQYAETSQSVKYYHKLKEMYISKIEYDSIIMYYECLYATTSQEKRSEITNKRRLLLEQYPQLLSIKNFDNIPDIRDYIVEEQGFVVINTINGDSSDIIQEVPLGKTLWFLNYVSFSYDNRYVAIAGRYPDNTYDDGKSIGGLFMIYDLLNRNVVYKNTDGDACWRALFTMDNKVASYSSTPNTYLCKIENTNLSSNTLYGKSFLTFSPDGKYMALSEQGYIRCNMEKNGIEWGHMPSTSVYVRSVDNPTLDIMPLINDLSDSEIIGSKVKNTTASCSFSIDNKKLMMVGSDGVVIIRNLYLD